jgi:SAM-dependent methyltransferase
MPQAPKPHGDTDYAVAGVGYAAQRRADPSIAASILQALGDAARVMNVGAGAGSYEPTDRLVIAVEPDATMRSQRPYNAAPCVIGAAQALPFDDASFDAVMAISTIHQWTDLQSGLAEMRRVARNRVVILTSDPIAFCTYWLCEYAPALKEKEAPRFIPIPALAALLGGKVTSTPVRVPLHCTDGFNEAFYGRPEALLDARVRAAQSCWLRIGPHAEAAAVARLAEDLESGAWDARYGALRTLPAYESSWRLVIAEMS